ncbi:MAG TPA: nucleotidyltransferase family protein [Gemmataceae bacterium]
MDISTVPAALLAGGLATRLRPITETIPKAMIEVAGRPFIDHQLTLLRRNGIRHVVLCLGHLCEQIEQYLGDGTAHGLELRYSHDGDCLLGTGGALRRALPLLGEVFWVLYGDSYMDIDYRAVLAHFAASQARGLMTVIHNENRWDRSNVVFRDGRLLCYSKRAPTEEMKHIDYGVTLLCGEVLTSLPADEPSDLADLLKDMAANGELMGHEVTQRFYEIGSHRGLEETQRYLQARSA